MAPTDDPKLIKSDETLLQIIDAIRANGGATVTEVASELGLAKSTVFRHLKTLEKHRFVSSEEFTYQIGLRFLELGVDAREGYYYEQIKPFIEDLANESGEFTGFLVEEHGLGRYIYLDRQGVPSDARIGERLFLNQSAAGKAILAHLDEERVHDIIERHGLPRKTEATITDKDELFRELETIRERGYSIVKGDHTEMLWGIGAPVLLYNERLIGGITIAGPSYRTDEEKIEYDLPKLLLGKLKEFELQVTYDI